MRQEPPAVVLNALRNKDATSTTRWIANETVSSVEYFLTSLPAVTHEHLFLKKCCLSELKINHQFVSLYHLWTSECDSSSQNMTLLSITLLRCSVYNSFFVRSSILYSWNEFSDSRYGLFRVTEGQSRSHSRVRHDWYPEPVANVNPAVMWICEGVNEIWVFHQRGRLTVNMLVITFYCGRF